MDGEVNRKKRKEIIDIELPKAMILVRRAIGNAGKGNSDTAPLSSALKAIENIKDKVHATYNSERGPFRPEMCRVWRPLADLNGVKEIRKAIEVLLSLLFFTPPFVLIIVSLD